MESRWMPSVAGILDIIVGALSLVASLVIALLMNVFFASSYDYFTGPEFSAVVIWLLLFAPYFIISLLALIGGIFSLKKKAWGLALTGAICALLTVWAWPLGVVSIIFTSLSKKEFDHQHSMFPHSVIAPSSNPDQSPQ